MPKELIVNHTIPETRAAYFEDGQITDFAIERRNEKGVTGNIYKGKVLRVLPGMQACFVDIGLEKAAFLYVDEIYKDNMKQGVEVLEDDDSEEPDVPSEDGEDGDADEKGSNKESASQSGSVRGEGRMKKKVRESGDDDDVHLKVKSKQSVSIEQLVKEGDLLLVQVAKGPIASKGARLTCHISLAGRNLVFMPTLNHIGVSRKISSYEERRRLRDLIRKMRPESTGFIVRTACENVSEEKLQQDVNYLVSLWTEITQDYEKAQPGSLVHEDLNLVLKMIRDTVAEDVNRIIIDNELLCNKVMRFVSKHMPHFKDVIYPYMDSDPIFDTYGIDLELDRALQRQVWLKSGGYIIIDQTEALVSIDVNTGKFVGKKDLEETITQTNIEAVREIAYQLRLRNCGGIIIIDLIDMDDTSNQRKVYEALEDAIRRDKSKVNILKMSEFGLIQMTRKRTRDTLVRTMCEPCYYCNGRGYVRNRQTVSYEVLREIARDAKKVSEKSLFVYVHPAVAEQLEASEKDALDYIETNFTKQIKIRYDSGFHLEQYEIYSA